MIDIRKLKELVRLMVSNDLTELDLRDSEEQVTLRRAGVHVPPQVYAAPVAAPPAAAAVPTAPAHTASSQQPPSQPGAPAAEEEGLIHIESPMVGTFYASANPDSPPFVEAGQKVNAETVVCIIEAMKIFNEIKAECSGTIQRMLVKNGQAVEFGQPLFLVKPD